MPVDETLFSEREKEVIGLLLQGKSNKQIALELGRANRTVEFHLSNIYAKLGVNSRSEAILKLADSALRQSASRNQVKSTAAKTSDSAENGLQSILRRIDMKKLIYLLAGISTTTLVIVLLLTNPTSPDRSSPPATALPLASPTPTELATPTTPPTLPPSNPVIPAHTVDGYTAAIESYHVDSSHVLFVVRLTGGEATFGSQHYYGRIESPNLLDESGAQINTSGGWGPAVDPALILFEFVPVTLLKGERLKGQFAFNVTDAPNYEKILARFRFDLDLPIQPDVRFRPAQTVTANNLALLLDSVTVAPNFTQIYLCFPSPSFADWNIGSQSTLQIDGQEATPLNYSVPFDSALGGDRTAGSEPYWSAPVKDGRCIKAGFPIGSNAPKSLTLTIPQLDKLQPDVLLGEQLARDYPGLAPKQAYYTYLKERGQLYSGPWTFTVELTP